MSARVTLAAAVLAVAACSSSAGSSSQHLGVGGSVGGGGNGGTGGAAGGNSVVITVPAAINRNLDVVFVVDDAPGTGPAPQQQLVSAFSEYARILSSLPGGLPNVHIGVVSTNIGTGAANDLGGCTNGGDQGGFQSRPRGPTCATAGLNPGQNFLINVNGQRNYTGTLADAFTCIAMLGNDGCAIKQPLESALRALGADGAPPPAQNANFLRNDAYLQIVVLSDEDDCSVPPNSDLFDANAANLGPRTSYRCSRFGHLCAGEQPPDQTTSAADLGTCVSAEDGRLLRVRDVVAALKTLKADPSKIMVAAIGGPPTPYVVDVGPTVEPSCSVAGSGVTGEPGVRLKQWVDAFGQQGVFQTICSSDFMPAMTAIANQVARMIGPACLPAAIDASTCKAVDRYVDSAGTTVQKPLRACTDPGDTGPCWSTVEKTSQCPNDQSVIFLRPGAPVASGLTTTLTCTR